MTLTQRIQLEQSKLRETINRLLGLAEMTTEQRSELTVATERATALEVELRAAILVEPEVTITEGVDAEARERLELRGKSQVVNYVKAACEMRSVSGPEAEFNSALSMGADQFPLELLAPEQRQTTATDTATNQGTWLDRLFDQAAAQYLGITFTSVPAGVASFPITTAGSSASQQAKSEAASAAAWTIGVVTMEPKRNAVHAIFSIEDAARLGPGLEDALQRDLRMALVAGIDEAIFKGDSGPSGTSADIVGLQTAGIAESTLTQANKLKADEILKVLASFIDGKHATSPGDIQIVASVGSNVLWLTQVQAATVQNQTVAQFLRDSGISWQTRGSIDTATSNGDYAGYVGAQYGSGWRGCRCGVGKCEPD